MKLNYSDLPPSWIYCLNDGCVLHETCIRWHSSLVLPEDKLTVTCVVPAAAKMDCCPYYKKLREVRLAWGFNRMLTNVKVSDSSEIRQKMWNILGSRTTFYRYNNGVMKLTPEQQEEIVALFKEYGYTENLEFDNYEVGIDI